MPGFGGGFGIGWGGGLPAPSPDAGVLVPPIPGAPDLITQARSRVIWQYQDKPNLAATIDMVVSLYQDLANAASLIGELDDLDIAGGVNLTVTAALIGQARTLPDGVVLGDAELRILAKARILRNHAKGTGPDLITSAAFIFSAVVYYRSFGFMSAILMIGRAPTAEETSALKTDVLPRPAGVRLDVGWYTPGAYFGFFADPGALGFDTGEFASLTIPP